MLRVPIRRKDQRFVIFSRGHCDSPAHRRYAMMSGALRRPFRNFGAHFYAAKGVNAVEEDLETLRYAMGPMV